MSDLIKVAVVDDSPLVRQSLLEILEQEPEFKVLWVASNPMIAEKHMMQDAPDVLILDVEMPEMNGIDYLKSLMRTNPLPVIICSGHAAKGGARAIEALELGAVDIIEKPTLTSRQFFEQSKMMIVDYVRAAAKINLKNQAIVPQQAPVPDVTIQKNLKFSADVIITSEHEHLAFGQTQTVIVIGASTGGTEALKFFLQELPPNVPGIVIVQHMPQGFTRAFAERLNSLCAIEVREASHGEEVKPGLALIAPGNQHALLRRQGRQYFVEVRDGPLVNRHRPSVDVLFRSAARYAGPNAVGIILTGMGDDGAEGLQEMKKAGAITFAQDEESCVVFGMPAVAIKRGAVDYIVNIKQMSSFVLKQIQERNLKKGGFP